MDPGIDSPAVQLFAEVPKEIAAAIIKLQSTVRALDKSAKNDHFKNTYAPLDEVMDAALPLLTEVKLGLMQWPVTIDGKHYLHTVLLHEDGPSLQADIALLLVKQDPQGLGSAITYTRRQTVMAILGLSAKDEDDDGNKASNHQQPPSPEQIEQIKAMCLDLKYPEEDVQRRLRTIRSFDHANLAITKLETVISMRGQRASSEAATNIDIVTVPTDDSRGSYKAVESRLKNFGFVDNKTISSFILATTKKPLLGNCKEPELRLINEALDRIESGEEQIPEDWMKQEPAKAGASTVEVTPPEDTA
ncbi:ERF family protein [Paenarthrobacter sp. MSM-2-10-13]|uniref:ERF family protein n=1 Tax=Paenarthrobacter sp. MSM-2-10-13 TaxID=2717318 RepID=UPI001421CEF2|nr:ERF family protein [Paenarthrobacter sp. MSM-2-10-13]NHW45932.1 ERF family protein [Paenarthrobacter sp. MSM-2-10-13]